MNPTVGTLHDSMRPILTAAIAAVEACAVALAGLVAVVIPALLLWFFTFDMAGEPAAMFGASVSVWLLAHGIPLSFRISPESALEYGLAPEAIDFTLSLAPLGITLVTVALAARAGLRFASNGGSGAAGVVGGMLGFGAATAVLSQFALALGDTNAWSLLLIPTAIYTAAALLAFLIRAANSGHPWWQRLSRWVQRQFTRVGVRRAESVWSLLGQTLRLMVATVALVVALAALSVAAAIVAGYIEITTLSQGLQLDLVGNLVVFLAQLALLPVFCLWAIAWWSGAGFALGTGSSISPFGALTGPLPSLPILGAIPPGWGATAMLAPALVVIAALGLGVLSVRLTSLRSAGWVSLVVTPLLAAALSGVVIAFAMMFSVGEIGPDRLSEVGPDPWLVGGFVAGEVGLGLVLGVLGGKIDRRRLQVMFPSVGRPADAKTEARYLEASQTPPREALFRSVGRRRNSRSGRVAEEKVPAEGAAAEPWGLDTPDTQVPDTQVSDTQEVDPGVSDTQVTEPLPDFHTDTDEVPELERDPDPAPEPEAEIGAEPESVPESESESEAEAEAEAESEVESEAEIKAEAGSAPETDEPLEMTKEEEAELLRAFSWDQSAEPAQEGAPSRSNWRWPGAKG